MVVENPEKEFVQPRPQERSIARSDEDDLSTGGSEAL